MCTYTSNDSFAIQEFCLSFSNFTSGIVTKLRYWVSLKNLINELANETKIEGRKINQFDN